MEALPKNSSSLGIPSRTFLDYLNNSSSFIFYNSAGEDANGHPATSASPSAPSSSTAHPTAGNLTESKGISLAESKGISLAESKGIIFKLNGSSGVASNGVCSHCFVIDGELIYHCSECAKLKQSEGDPSSSTTATPSSSSSSSSANSTSSTPSASSTSSTTTTQSTPTSSQQQQQQQKSSSSSSSQRSPRSPSSPNEEKSSIAADEDVTSSRPTKRSKSNQSLALTYRAPSLEEQIEETLEMISGKGFDELCEFLVALRRSTGTTDIRRASSFIAPPSPSSLPSLPSLAVVPVCYPNIITPPPSELLPGYYIYNKAIDTDTEHKEKLWIQIELPRNIVVDKFGKYLAVSLAMEMGPIPSDPNTFLELDSSHLQGIEGSLITETVTHCIYTFDKLRIPNRALISEVLNTRYQGLRAGRFVFKVEDEVLPNKSARFIIKAPSGNRIRSVNSKAKKHKKSSATSSRSNSYNSSSSSQYDSDY